MLQAVIKKKFATAPDAADDDVSAGSNAKREDTLTSTVLGLLLQLPDKLLWQVLHQASNPKLLPEDGGELLSYEFWPYSPNEELLKTLENSINLRIMRF